MEQGAVQGKRDRGDLSQSFTIVSSEYMVSSQTLPEVCVLREFSCPSRKASLNKNNKSR